MSTRDWALCGVLLAALAIRLGALATQTYVIFADDMFQYLEQGHRLAFRDGIVPWEYHDGIRSWLLPGVIAGLMRIGIWIGDDPVPYLMLVRGTCAVLSLAVVWAGFCLAERAYGLGAAVMTGLFCAVWFDLVWFSQGVLTETVAAHVLLLGLVLGGADPPVRRRMLAAGACFGLAFCLRYQYALAIAVIALAQYRLSWPKWRDALIGGVVVALLAGGLLDWLTWGLPFQSIWLHFLRNTADGVATAIGTESPTFFLRYLTVALVPAPLLMGLALLGMTRAWPLGLAALATLLAHSAVPHKEVRFIYLTIAAVPILVGLGTALLLDRFRMRHVAAFAVPVALWTGLSLMGATGQALGARWSVNRPQVEAFMAASRLPALCGLAIRDMGLIHGGGYTYLHRGVPLFYQQVTNEIALPGARITLRFSVERGGEPEPLRPITPGVGYNAMIAHEGKGDADLPQVMCFPDATRPENPVYCLFHDPGRRCE